MLGGEFNGEWSTTCTKIDVIKLAKNPENAEIEEKIADLPMALFAPSAVAVKDEQGTKAIYVVGGDLQSTLIFKYQGRVPGAYISHVRPEKDQFKWQLLQLESTNLSVSLGFTGLLLIRDSLLLVGGLHRNSGALL